MNEPTNSTVWLKTDDEKLRSLLADIAKSQAIVEASMANLQQLKTKIRFQIALVNQLIESQKMKGNK
jgi:hypothetical protein